MIFAIYSKTFIKTPPATVSCKTKRRRRTLLHSCRYLLPIPDCGDGDLAFAFPPHKQPIAQHPLGAHLTHEKDWTIFGGCVENVRNPRNPRKSGWTGSFGAIYCTAPLTYLRRRWPSDEKHTYLETESAKEPLLPNSPQLPKLVPERRLHTYAAFVTFRLVTFKLIGRIYKHPHECSG